MSVPWPPTYWAQAIFLPFGEMAGSVSAPGWLVRRSSPVPSGATEYSSVSPPATRLDWKTICLPAACAPPGTAAATATRARALRTSAERCMAEGPPETDWIVGRTLPSLATATSGRHRGIPQDPTPAFAVAGRDRDT